MVWKVDASAGSTFRMAVSSAGSIVAGWNRELPAINPAAGQGKVRKNYKENTTLAVSRISSLRLLEFVGPVTSTRASLADDTTFYRETASDARPGLGFVAWWCNPNRAELSNGELGAEADEIHLALQEMRSYQRQTSPSMMTRAMDSQRT